MGMGTAMSVWPYKLKGTLGARQRVLKGDTPCCVNFAGKRETSRNNLPDGERRKFRKTNKRGEIF